MVRNPRFERRALLALAGLSLLIPCMSAKAMGQGQAPLSEEQFRKLLMRVARAWNVGDAADAASAFSEDATYIEPPDKQRCIGREALFRFFGGGTANADRMRMEWHHMAFDVAAQTGYGEYTFALPERGFQAHGIAVVEIHDGLISSWREYQYRSNLPFGVFSGKNARTEGLP